MRSYLFLVVLLTGCSCDLRVLVNRQTGLYNVTVNNYLWFRSSWTSLYADDRWYSSEDGSLSFIDTQTASGNDPFLGDWNETQLIYELDRLSTKTNVTGRIRQWSSFPAISFHLDVGKQPLTNTIPLTMDEVRTAFPSFHIEEINVVDNRGYFTYADLMMGEIDRHADRWNASSKVIHSGIKSGPVVVLNLTSQGQGDAIVLSPFSQFMATSLSQQNQVLQYGVMGSMSSVPSNYHHSMIMFYSNRGANAAVRDWGQFMRQAYNRTIEHRLNDITVNYLGYYTDNGAYYYYNTAEHMNYEETMVSIVHRIPLPFHYVQIDSWWYYKGIGDGVTEWTSRPDIFPDGLPTVYRRMENIPIAAHNRYWASDTVYAGKYAFAIDTSHGKALPISNDSFWLDLLKQAHDDWGLILYEQDWMNDQTIQFNPTRTDIELGHRWLTAMGAAADQVGINIQYCMTLPRHALQSLEIPRVTQARVSTDYEFHIVQKAPQWNIGVSSMFADALGLAPFKDVFWSTNYEAGAPYKGTVFEILPDREILIATLSTGPVGPGDAIEYTDVQRIMRCCRQDGLILKPDRPITMIDSMIADWVENRGVSRGEIYSTQSNLNDQTFHIVFASAVQKDVSLWPSMINAQTGLIWSYDNVSSLTIFDETHPLAIPADRCNASSFCLWYVSPVWSFADSDNTRFALLGESTKWTAVSKQRFSSLSMDEKNFQTIITIEGAALETVQLLVYHSKLSLVHLNCTIINSSKQVIITPSTVSC